MNQVLQFNGYELQPDANGNLSLTEFWRAAGSPSKKAPGNWKNQKGNRAFIGHIVNTHKKGGLPLITSTPGKHGGTVAHPQIALAYAKFLNHELHALVNRTFFERVAEERNPEKIADRYVATLRRRGLSDQHIAARLESKGSRVRFTGTLAAHGVKGEGYRDCTNAVYYQLFGGPAAVVRRKVGAKPKENPREHMGILQLRSVEMVELLAADSIEGENLHGNAACVAECTRAGAGVRQLLLSHRRKNLS